MHFRLYVSFVTCLRVFKMELDDVEDGLVEIDKSALTHSIQSTPGLGKIWRWGSHSVVKLIRGN